MVKFCCVPFCRSRKPKDRRLLFHSFPVSAHLRKQWLAAVQQNTRKSPRHPSPLKIGEHAKVCSRHFSKTDYWHIGSVVRLRKNAVPTVFAWPKEKEDDDTILTKLKKRQTEDKKKAQLHCTNYLQSKEAVHSKEKNKSKKVNLVNSQKNKHRSCNGIKKMEGLKMIQNCRHLL